MFVAEREWILEWCPDPDRILSEKRSRNLNFMLAKLHNRISRPFFAHTKPHFNFYEPEENYLQPVFRFSKNYPCPCGHENFCSCPDALISREWMPGMVKFNWGQKIVFNITFSVTFLNIFYSNFIQKGSLKTHKLSTHSTSHVFLRCFKFTNEIQNFRKCRRTIIERGCLWLKEIPTAITFAIEQHRLK